MIRFLVTALLWLGLARGAALAQAVAGRLASPAGQAVPGALLTLLDSAGSAVRATVSDSSGRFAIEAVAPGRHVLRVERIGHATFSTEALQLEPETTLTLTLAVQSPRLGLRDVGPAEVPCRAGPGTGGVLALWEQAARALRTRALAQEAGLAAATGVRYVRMLDNRYRIKQGIIDEEPFSTVVLPFPEFPAAAGGAFAARDAAGVAHYRVPSPDVLLSPSFLAGHCVDRVLADKATPHRVGLRFRPAPGNEQPAIEGVLWFDRESGDLGVLEYQYRGPRELVPRDARGLVDFTVDAAGMPRVSRWWVRVPRVFETSHTVGGRAERNTEPVESGVLAFGPGGDPLEDPEGLFPLMTGVIALDELVVAAKRQEFEAYLDAQPWRPYQGALGIIKPAEVMAAPPTNAFDVVRSLRQRWLVADPGPVPCYPSVYFDNMRLSDTRGGVPRAAGRQSTSPLEDVLTQVPAPMIGAIEYIRPQEAAMIYGAINVGTCGVIVVHSRRW